VSLTWVAAAGIIAVASFVMGLTGFGIGLVSLAVLPFLMSPVTAVVLMTIYSLVFALVLFVQLRRDVAPAAIAELMVGTVIGAPLGVWGLATLPIPVLNRLIGAMLIVAVLLEWVGRYPRDLSGRGWGVGAGALAGAFGGAVGLPGPPVLAYAVARSWNPRTLKANLQAFFIVNQGVILSGYWWAGLLTAEVWRLTAAFAVPAVLGVLAGVALFNRVDHVRFRRIVFALLFVSGLALLIGG
jgi:uncharacterized membrane protein YfcA